MGFSPLMLSAAGVFAAYFVLGQYAGKLQAAGFPYGSR